MVRRSTKINMAIVIDALIASVIVTAAPGIINQTFFKTNPVSGMTLNLLGGGAAYLLGMLLKKPNVSNIGIALAVVNIAMPMINQAIGQFTGTATPAVQTTGMADYMRLKEYVSQTRAMQIEPYQDYALNYAGRYN